MEMIREYGTEQGQEAFKSGLRGSGTPECPHNCTTQGDYVGAAAKAAGELYGYGHTNVLFKPTKARVDLR